MERQGHRPLRCCVGSLISGLFVTGAAMAGDGPFYCRSKIIDVGMMESEVLAHCGEPSSQSTEGQEVRSSNNRVLSVTKIDRWTYRAYNSTRFLVFVDEKLQSIERL